MKAYLIMGAIILVLILVVIVLIKGLITATKKQRELKTSLESSTNNINKLLAHSEILTKLNKNKTEVYKKLAEAKSDEEFNQIIANLIISNNNNKLQNSAAK